MTRPRIGLMAGGAGSDLAAVEALPIDSLWVGGHVASPNGAPEVLVALRNLEEESEDIEHQPLNLSEDYLRAGAAACDKRVIQAGFRLGAILKALAN